MARVARALPVVPVLAVAVAGTAVSGIGLVASRGADRPPPATAVGVPTPLDTITAPISMTAGSVAPAPLASSPPTAGPLPASPAATNAPPATPPAPAGAVAPLAALHPADALVTLDRSLTPAELGQLAHLPGMAGVLPVDVGTVTVAGAPALTLGVDPSAFRAFTPQVTAASDPLWQSVARGELVASYDLHNAHPVPLGDTVPVAARAIEPVRLGAVATLGLPGVQAVVDHGRAAGLGLLSAGGAVLSAPGRDPQALARDVTQVLGPRATVALVTPSAAPAGQPASTVASGKPRTYQQLYRAAARTCRGLSWGVLAAIGQVESGHGRNTGPSSAGALGPMQFLPATFALVGVDGDGDGVANIQDPFDAVYSAARLLCESGAGAGGQSLYNAVFAYNHADWYAKGVLALAKAYVDKYGA